MMVLDSLWSVSALVSHTHSHETSGSRTPVPNTLSQFERSGTLRLSSFLTHRRQASSLLHMLAGEWLQCHPLMNRWIFLSL